MTERHVITWRDLYPDDPDRPSGFDIHIQRVPKGVAIEDADSGDYWVEDDETPGPVYLARLIQYNKDGTTETIFENSIVPLAKEMEPNAVTMVALLVFCGEPSPLYPWTRSQERFVKEFADDIGGVLFEREEHD